jgi:hypothetical protein
MQKPLGLSNFGLVGLLNRLNEVVEQHVNAERRLGVEIHPAARKQSFSQEGREDDDRKYQTACPLPSSRSLAHVLTNCDHLSLQGTR